MRPISILVILLSLTVMSFKDSKEPEKQQLITGTYNGGSCANSVKLTINEGGNFHYVNKTDPDKPIDVKGKWELRHNTIILKDFPAGQPIHDKWKVDGSYPCVRSGFQHFQVIRLCKD